MSQHSQTSDPPLAAGPYLLITAVILHHAPRHARRWPVQGALAPAALRHSPLHLAPAPAAAAAAVAPVWPVDPRRRDPVRRRARRPARVRDQPAAARREGVERQHDRDQRDGHILPVPPGPPARRHVHAHVPPRPPDRLLPRAARPARAVLQEAARHHARRRHRRRGPRHVGRHGPHRHPPAPAPLWRRRRPRGPDQEARRRARRRRRRRLQVPRRQAAQDAQLCRARQGQADTRYCLVDPRLAAVRLAARRGRALRPQPLHPRHPPLHRRLPRRRCRQVARVRPGAGRRVHHGRAARRRVLFPAAAAHRRRRKLGCRRRCRPRPQRGRARPGPRGRRHACGAAVARGDQQGRLRRRQAPVARPPPHGPRQGGRGTVPDGRPHSAQFLRDLHAFFNVRFKIVPFASVSAASLAMKVAEAPADEDGQDEDAEGDEGDEVALGAGAGGRTGTGEVLVSCVGIGYSNVNKAMA